VPVHYSHDPSKDFEWAARLKATFPTEQLWEREMELNFAAVSGTAAYPKFNPAINVAPKEIAAIAALPLCVTMDFNVAPMILLVGQMLQGNARVLAEVVRNPADIKGVIEDFRNLYPQHAAGLQIYGDATGQGRNPQTAGSHWDLVRLALSNYPARVGWFVPSVNPKVMDRVNAVNYKLEARGGFPGTLIAPTCHELIADLAEVILDDDGRDIKKTSKPGDPYSKRTHASDAFGYWVWREWPLALEEPPLPAGVRPKKRVPLKYGRLAGE
jgi:hypothetical protein